jgi:hypothetical protein
MFSTQRHHSWLFHTALLLTVTAHSTVFAQTEDNAANRQKVAAPLADAATPSQSAQQSEPVILYSDSASSGLLFLDGTFIDPPYRLAATRSGITVNGIASTVETTTTESTSPDQPARRRRNSSEDQPGFGRPAEGRFGERRSSEGRFDEGRFGGNRFGWSRRPQHARQAREIVDALSADGIVVLFGNHHIVISESSSQDFTFCSTLLADNRTSEMRQDFVSLEPDEALRPQWSNWLDSFHPTGALREALSQRVEHIESIEQQNRQQIAAVQRLDQLSYPLTIAGMLIGVLAMGHMMQWAGKGLGEEGSAAVRSTEIALLFVLAMSVIDLIWTILAGQAGAMKELNPFAAQYLHSPLSLALFKTVATACGCGILYIWRSRRQIQHATWWVCLVCVLLTFRWVVLDSMVS